MSCPAEDVWLAFLDGTTEKAETEALEAHLDGCARCRQLTAAIIRARGENEAPRSSPTFFASRTLLAGAALGRYELIERLGEGGMGVVYEAHDPKLERRVAIKVIKQGSGSGQDAQHERLLAEARALAKVSHRNVITVHDVGALDGQVYIAMELIRGVTLREYAKAHSASEVMARLFEAANGLLAAHHAGLVHGDFKPDNVLISASGHAVVTDFGLAQPIDGHQSTPGLGAGDALRGTPRYMAPEQRRGERATARSDQFAFCKSVHELLGMGRKGASPGLVSVLRRGTAGDPLERFDSMSELLREIERVPRKRRLRMGLALISVVVSFTVAAYTIDVSHRTELEAKCRDEAGTVKTALSSSQLGVLRSGALEPRLSETLTRIEGRLQKYRSDAVELAGVACRQGNDTKRKCVAEAVGSYVALQHLFEIDYGQKALRRLGSRLTEVLLPLTDCERADWASLATPSQTEATVMVLMHGTWLAHPVNATPHPVNRGDFESAEQIAEDASQPALLVSLHAQHAAALASTDGGVAAAKREVAEAETVFAAMPTKAPSLSTQIERAKGLLAVAENDRVGAEQHLRVALDDSEKAYGKTDTRFAIGLQEHADVWQSVGNSFGASRDSSRALGLLRANEGPEHPDLLPMLRAQSLQRSGPTGPAEYTAFDRASEIVKIARATFEPHSVELAQWLLVAANDADGAFGLSAVDRDQSLHWLEEATTLYARHDTQTEHRQAQLLMINRLLRGFDAEKSLSYCRSLYTQWSQWEDFKGGDALAPTPTDVGTAARCVGRSYAQLTDYEKATAYLNKALEVVPPGDLATETQRELNGINAMPLPPPPGPTEDQKVRMAEAAKTGQTSMPYGNLFELVADRPNAKVVFGSDGARDKLRDYQQRRLNDLTARAQRRDAVAKAELERMHTQQLRDQAAQEGLRQRFKRHKPDGFGQPGESFLDALKDAVDDGKVEVTSKGASLTVHIKSANSSWGWSYISAVPGADEVRYTLTGADIAKLVDSAQPLVRSAEPTDGGFKEVSAASTLIIKRTFASVLGIDGGR